MPKVQYQAARLWLGNQSNKGVRLHKAIFDILTDRLRGREAAARSFRRIFYKPSSLCSPQSTEAILLNSLQVNP